LPEVVVGLLAGVAAGLGFNRFVARIS
jgi:hypothetical protein